MGAATQADKTKNRPAELQPAWKALRTNTFSNAPKFRFNLNKFLINNKNYSRSQNLAIF
jgi:hypothetical protein